MKKYADGGNASRNKEIAQTILQQLGGAGRLRMMTGAYNFIAIEYGVSFRIKNPRANFIKITLTPMDLYDLEIGRVRGTTYKVIAKHEGVYNDMLKPLIEKATGMYLSLFAKGGGVGKSKSYLHLYKLTYPNGQYRVESYDGEAMTPKEALEKMRISLRGLKSYKYSGASSDSENYKKWYHKKDNGYSDTEAWDEVFGKEKYAKGGAMKNKYADGGQTDKSFTYDIRSVMGVQNQGKRNEKFMRIWGGEVLQNGEVVALIEFKYFSQEEATTVAKNIIEKLKSSKMAKGGKMNNSGADLSTIDYAKGGLMGKLKSTASNLGKSVKSGYSKGKQYAKDKLHQKKKDIALDVIYETKEKLAKGRDEMMATEKAYNVVDKRYSKGGAMKNKYADGGQTDKSFTYDIRSVMGVQNQGKRNEKFMRIWGGEVLQNGEVVALIEFKYFSQEEATTVAKNIIEKLKSSKMAKGGKMNNSGADLSTIDYAKGGLMGKLKSTASNLGKSVKSGYSKGKQYAKDKLHQKKKDIALDVIYETKEKLAKGRDEMMATEKTYNVVDKRYAKGGKTSNASKIDLTISRKSGDEQKEVGKFKHYGDALISASALNEKSPVNYDYKVKPISKYAKGGSVSTSELNDLLEKINSESGADFRIGGAYGNYELWGKDKDGGEHRIEVGSRKDIKEALIRNRYNKKYTKYAKGGAIGGYNYSIGGL